MKDFIELTREDDGSKMLVNPEHITHVCPRKPSGSTIHFAACEHLPKGVQVKEALACPAKGGELKIEMPPTPEEVAAAEAEEAEKKHKRGHH
jgi:hypothetical protein